MHAQKGFRIEASIGPTLVDSNEYYSFTLQGNLHYLWEVSKGINIGATTGILIFLGDISNTENMYTELNPDEYKPDVHIPLSIAGRASL